jgi:hypothetical protein
MGIPTELVPAMPNAFVQPVGLAKQWILDDQAKRVTKHRITQDLSCLETSKESPLSIKSRIDMDQHHQETVCSWALPRIIHLILASQLAWPKRTVFISKHNHGDACRQIAHSALAVA